MTKTITLRLPREVYDLFKRWAEIDNRPISNWIETAALRHAQEDLYVERDEMESIRADRTLVGRLREGSRAAKRRKGRLVG